MHDVLKFYKFIVALKPHYVKAVGTQYEIGKIVNKSENKFDLCCSFSQCYAKVWNP